MNIHDIIFEDIMIESIQVNRLYLKKGDIKTEVALDIGYLDDEEHPTKWVGKMRLDMVCESTDSDDEPANIYNIFIKGYFDAPLEYKDKIRDANFANIVSIHMYSFIKDISQPILDNLLKRKFTLPLSFYAA